MAKKNLSSPKRSINCLAFSVLIKVKEEPLVIKVGEELKDTDEVMAIDNYDTLLIIERIYDGINTNKEGNYKLGYKVTDSSGNMTIAYRDVIVVKEENNTSWYIVGASLLILILGSASVVCLKKRRKN